MFGKEFLKITEDIYFWRLSIVLISHPGKVYSSKKTCFIQLKEEKNTFYQAWKKKLVFVKFYWRSGVAWFVILIKTFTHLWKNWICLWLRSKYRLRSRFCGSETWTSGGDRRIRFGIDDIINIINIIININITIIVIINIIIIIQVTPAGEYRN